MAHRMFFIFSTLLLLLAIPARAEEGDTPEARLAAAQELVDKTVTTAFVENMVNSLWPPVEQNIRSKNPGISDEAVAGLKRDLAAQQVVLVSELVVDMPAIYAKYFTAGELKQILEFQLSDVGRKSLELQPKIMAEVMPKILKSIQEQTPAIMERFRKKAEEKGYKL